MSKLLRLLSIKRKPSKRDQVDSSAHKRAKDTDIECKIMHLDSNDFKFFVEKKALGNILEDYIFHQIEVTNDRNYFGLQFSDEKGINHWLDTSKQIRKQCEVGPPYSLRLRVKFFSSDPCGQMHDEYTRYLFVLQLKQMIRDGELLCEDEDLAASLAALSLQGELGDYDEREHTPIFISQYRFLPESQQTEQFELNVLEKYGLMKNRSMVPSITDRQYLERCRSLPDYGVDRHSIKGQNGKDYELGLTPTGILIYETKTKIGLFPWSQVTKLSFKKNRFKIVILDIQEDIEGQFEHTFVFQNVDVAACKQMWKSCVENHAFYRLEGSHKAPTKFQQLFRLKSRFYASFHTEYQITVKNTFGTSTGRSSTFQRAPSLRGAPRASFARNEMERQKIQQRNRDRVREESKMAMLQRIDSNDQPGSNDSTPTSTLNFVKNNKSEDIALNMNLSQNPQPRIYSQESTITHTSTLSRKSSAGSTSSESIEANEVHSKRTISKPKKSNSVLSSKTNTSKSMATSNNNNNDNNNSSRAPLNRTNSTPEESNIKVKQSIVSNESSKDEIILL